MNPVTHDGEGGRYLALTETLEESGGRTFRLSVCFEPARLGAILYHDILHNIISHTKIYGKYYIIAYCIQCYYRLYYMIV